MKNKASPKPSKEALMGPVELPILNKEPVKGVQLPQFAYDELTALRAILRNSGSAILPEELRAFVEEKQGDRQDVWPRGLVAGIAFRFTREALLRGER